MNVFECVCGCVCVVCVQGDCVSACEFSVNVFECVCVVCVFSVNVCLVCVFSVTVFVCE